MGDSLEDRVRTLEVRQAMTDQKIDTMGQDVKDIKNTLMWLNRLAVGAIVIAVLNLVMKAG
jgi:uncharacterized protein Smg (DUF494 family)